MFRKLVPTIAAQPRPLAHDGYLHLLEARRGRGKSYVMTHLVRDCVLQRIPVRTNFALHTYRLAVQAAMAGSFTNVGEAMAWVNENVVLASTWDDVLTAYDSVILLDEASRLFDSRTRSAPPVALEWLQQSRKLRLTLVFASQSFDWLDVRVRQLADVLWMVRKESKRVRGREMPVKFWGYGLDPFARGLTESVVRDRADYRWSVPFVVSTAQLYDSWELIRILEGTPSWDSMGELADWHAAQGRVGAAAALRSTARSAAGASTERRSALGEVLALGLQ
jgi:hypothetical protein